jgi:uncharacterized membrane protein YcaP (DUF421 family)
VFNHLFKLEVPPLELVIRSIAVYVVLLLALRLFGKRQVGQFTLYDLVLVLLVANAVQPAITGPDVSLAGGILIILTLVLVNYGVSRLDRYRVFHRLLVPDPTIIIQNGHYLRNRLAREGIDEEDCEMAIREHGIDDVSQVRLGVLEPDGTISIVPSETKVLKTRRRVRYYRH